MRWFVYQQESNTRYFFVQAKNVGTSIKRLTRWGKLRKVDVTAARALNSGIGYETMSEAWAKYGTFTMIDSSF